MEKEEKKIPLFAIGAIATAAIIAILLVSAYVTSYSQPGCYFADTSFRCDTPRLPLILQDGEMIGYFTNEMQSNILVYGVMCSESHIPAKLDKPYEPIMVEAGETVYFSNLIPSGKLYCYTEEEETEGSPTTVSREGRYSSREMVNAYITVAYRYENESRGKGPYRSNIAVMTAGVV